MNELSLVPNTIYNAFCDEQKVHITIEYRISNSGNNIVPKLEWYICSKKALGNCFNETCKCHGGNEFCFKILN